MLLDAKAEVNKQDNDGGDALYAASVNGHLEVVKRLLEANANVSTQTKYGRTALHNAVCNGHRDVAELLLNAMATNSQGFQRDISTRISSFRTEPTTFSSPLLALVYHLVERYPRDHLFRNVLANLYIKAGMTNEAIISFDIALKLHPRNARITHILDVVHENACDNCTEGSIRGYRYKCLSCEDYDLCQKCFHMSPNPHPNHGFLTLPSDQWIAQMPHNSTG